MPTEGGDGLIGTLLGCGEVTVGQGGERDRTGRHRPALNTGMLGHAAAIVCAATAPSPVDGAATRARDRGGGALRRDVEFGGPASIAAWATVSASVVRPCMTVAAPSLM